MAERDIDNIIFGAGEVYLYAFDGTEIPEHSAVETTPNNVGHCSGGFQVSYKPDVYDVKNQYNKIVKRFLKAEDVSAKTGILTWDLKRLGLLTAAKFTEDTSAGTRTLTFGGGKSLQTVLLRFVHEKEDGKKLRFTMVGQGGNGFQIDFADKELVVDAEITAIEKIKGFLAEIEEEIDKE